MWSFGMKREFLSLLFAFALSGMAEAEPLSGGNWAAIKVKSAPAVNQHLVRLPATGQAGYFHHGVLASPSGMPGDTSKDRGPVNAGSSFLSWTHSITALLAPRTFEKNCLAMAVYFEARSETTLGQYAVATVILNRVKSPHYPSTVCGVVYQGASRPNACQFSFACDGKSDLPEAGRAWQKALAVSALALSGEKEIESEELQIFSTATHYHTDYVEPVWSKSLSRLTKIGHHIFYS
jgi:spore germination cell wall hydrolase CwlJ-like protein